MWSVHVFFLSLSVHSTYVYIMYTYIKNLVYTGMYHRECRCGQQICFIHFGRLCDSTEFGSSPKHIHVYIYTYKYAYGMCFLCRPGTNAHNRKFEVHKSAIMQPEYNWDFLGNYSFWLVECCSYHAGFPSRSSRAHDRWKAFRSEAAPDAPSGLLKHADVNAHGQ